MSQARLNAIFSVVLVSVFTLSAHAQQPKPEREGVSCRGKIKGIRPGLVHVVGDEGQQWLVAVEAKPENVSFQGTTTPAFLRPGMLVQFQATLDKKGEATTRVTELKLVSPRKGVQFGLQQEASQVGSELFASGDEIAAKKKKRVHEERPFSITGTLRGVKDGKIQVVASGAAITAELADNCSVSMDVSDYSLAREGDTVTASGWRYVQQPSQVHANQLTIVSERPVEMPIETKKRRSPVKGAKGGDRKPTSEKTEKASQEG